MKKKILLYYIVLVVLGIVGTGFFTSRLAHNFYRYEVEEKLKSIASLIKYQVTEKDAAHETIDYNMIAQKYSSVLGNPMNSFIDKDLITRVTFIDFKGNVLGESDKDYHSMENHLKRKEVQEALKGNIGTDIRKSASIGTDFLYLAVPVDKPQIILRVSVPLVQLKEIDETIMLYTIIGILIGMSLTILLALKFTSTLTAPVTELITVTHRIADGDYSKRTSLKTRDELGELSKTFNVMAERLERTVAELKDKNLKMDLIMNNLTNGIVAVDPGYKVILINKIACELFGIDKESDVLGENIIQVIRNNSINSLLRQSISDNASQITEIVIGTAEEKVLRIYSNPIQGVGKNIGGIISIHDITNIRKLEQIRTDFVSNVTHELKTPLTSIRGFVETLRNGAINDNAVADKFLEIIDIEAERLYMLINDILQLSEIENRQNDINIGEHDLKSIIDEIVSVLEGVAEKKNIRLETEVDEGITISVNRDRIKQMLINLVDNGIKYNVENGTVRISACRYEGKVIIQVKDTGIGIEKVHLPRIFERFYRVDKGRSRSLGGTGLGLSIVKHIVNLYNGDIKISSEPGKGTEFTIQLPV